MIFLDFIFPKLFQDGALFESNPFSFYKQIVYSIIIELDIINAVGRRSTARGQRGGQ